VLRVERQGDGAELLSLLPLQELHRLVASEGSHFSQIVPNGKDQHVLQNRRHERPLIGSAQPASQLHGGENVHVVVRPDETGDSGDVRDRHGNSAAAAWDLGRQAPPHACHGSAGELTSFLDGNRRDLPDDVARRAEGARLQDFLRHLGLGNHVLLDGGAGENVGRGHHHRSHVRDLQKLRLFGVQIKPDEYPGQDSKQDRDDDCRRALHEFSFLTLTPKADCSCNRDGCFRATSRRSRCTRRGRSPRDSRPTGPVHFRRRQDPVR